MKNRNLFGSVMGLFGVAAVGLALAAGSAVRADMIAYEGFDLSIGNGADLDGAAGGSTSTGFTGTWETTVADNMTYQGTGLSWNYVDPDVSTVGGAVNSGQTSNSYVVGGRQLPALGGSTVWGSYLTNGSTLTNAAAQLGLTVGGTTLNDFSGEFSIESKGYNDSMTVLVDNTTRLVHEAGQWNNQLVVGTTFMSLFKIENINVDGGEIGVSLWVMTQGQYDNLIYGGVPEDTLVAGLNSATLGTGDNQLWNRVRGTVDLEPGAAVSWAAGDWLRMMNDSNSNDVTFDEIRLATNLYGAAAIPEPSTLGLLAVSALLALRRRRGRG